MNERASKRIVVNGPVRLSGRVAASGAKNAVLPIMAASVMAPGTHRIENVPYLSDVTCMAHVLAGLGVEALWAAEFEHTEVPEGRITPRMERRNLYFRATDGFPPWAQQGRGILEIRVGELAGCRADYEMVQQMRAGVAVLGPLLARLGKAEISMPGGCVIGDRPIDLHLKGLGRLGARISVESGYIQATTDGFKGSRVYLGGQFGSTVLGTAAVLSAAALADGVTIIEHAAQEPEIVDLASFLGACGGRVSGAGSHRIVVEGVASLRAARHRLIPDRIEVGTLALAAAASQGDIRIVDARWDQLYALWDHLESAGVSVSEQAGAIHVAFEGRPRPLEVTTFPYPGFPTDLQAQMTAFLCRAEGTSRVVERVFPNRFHHVPELVRMGAAIRLAAPVAIVEGVGRLDGAEVEAKDLRASAALLIAAAAANGRTVIHDAGYLERGYENLPGKLAALGADVSIQ